ncbi:MAG: hypothetical protein KU29_03240 [Sulfurovum sp. FS06-10]|nr:MAG: hypothetical protein KU29_03240 [Sulfurovum sp. FS06-10]
MLKILARTVCVSFALAAIMVTQKAEAKDIPIVKKITLLMPLKEFSTVEFPFEIKSHDFTPFVSMSSSDEKDAISLPNLPPLNGKEQQDFALPSLDEKKQGATSPSSKQQNAPAMPSSLSPKKPVEWQKGKNFFKFYPRKLGETQLIVFGYEKFPIVINLKVVENKEGAEDSTYKFIDYEEHKEVASKFESTNHDKIVVSITKALYNNEPPKGYDVNTKQGEFYNPPFRFRLIKEYQGKLYSGIEYLVTNDGSQHVTLDWDMFKGQKGVYGITFDKDILSPKEQARLFIIKQRGEE